MFMKYLAKVEQRIMICGMPLEHEPSRFTISAPSASPDITKVIQAFGLAVLLSLQPDNKADAQIYFGNAKNELQTLHFKDDLFEAELILANKFANQFASLEKQSDGKIASPLVQNLQKEISVLALELEQLLQIRRALYAEDRNADLHEAKRARDLKEKSEKLKVFLLPNCTQQALEEMIVYKKMDVSMFQKLADLHGAYAKPDAYKKEIAQKALAELRSMETESPDTLRELLIKKLGCPLTAAIVTGARKMFLEDQYRHWSSELANAQERK